MGNGVFPLTVAQRELGIFPAWNKGVHKEVPLGYHLRWGVGIGPTSSGGVYYIYTLACAR